MTSSTIYRKDGGHLLVVASILLLPASIFIWPIVMGGFTERAITVSIYISPISLFFIYAIFRIHSSSKKKIIVSERGLTVEELSPTPIPWDHIYGVQVVNQPVYRGPTARWLVLNTKYDEKYSNKALRKLNKLMVDGVPSCNLTTYREEPEAIEACIRSNLKL